MPHEGFADPVTNDRTGFCSNMPVSELTERITRAIKAMVAETMDRVTHGTRPTSTEPNEAQGVRSPDINSGNQPTA